MASAIIYYTVFDNEDTPIDLKCIEALPEVLSKEILLYKKQDDINRLTAGKYLLKNALTDLGIPDAINNYEIDKMGKPFINNAPHFNITHSGQVVACAMINGEGAIGIDVEKIRQVEVEKFTKQFSPPEMMQILAAKDPQQKFFDYWTMKEAVMKADGRGMRIPLHSIRLRGDYATIDDKENNWYLYSKGLHPTVKSHICSNVKLDHIELKMFPLVQLLGM